MKNTKPFYRVAVNKDSDIYKHIEPCGEDLAFAERQYESIKKELSETDTIELQKDENITGEWVKVKKTWRYLAMVIASGRG
jgi:hypothetical protein